MNAGDLEIRSLGVIPFRDALALQADRAARRRAGACRDLLLLLEHPPVYSVGRSARPDQFRTPPPLLEAAGAEVVEVARGGGVTYHGPGQLIGYPIVDLAWFGRDVIAYLRALERTLIAALSCLGMDAAVRPGKTGVWTAAGGRKLASIGIGVRHGIALHGFALNVSNDLRPFDLIRPCGLEEPVTSIERELGRAVTRREAEDAVVAAFRAAWEAVPSPLDFVTADTLS